MIVTVTMNPAIDKTCLLYTSVRSIKEADEIVKAVDRENVGFVLDSYNLYLNGGNNDFSDIREIQPEKIFAVHLMSGDDAPAQERGQDKRCFCGQGAVDTDGFLKELKACGYNGMVSVETFRPEYWQKSPEWVIEQAYKTTYAAVSYTHLDVYKRQVWGYAVGGPGYQ